MRLFLLPLVFVSTAATAQTPISSPPPSTLTNAPKPPAEWEQRARDIYRTAVETPTVPGRGQVPKLAAYLADQLRAAGWADSDIHVLPYVSASDSNTAALIARWPAAGRPTKKPMLIIAHMDVVEALRSDWTHRSLQAGREGRLLLWPRDQRRQGRPGPQHGRDDEAASVRIRARPRRRPVLHRRRGDREQGRRARRHGMAQVDRRRVRAERRRRRRELHSRRQAARVRAADVGEDLPELLLPGSQPGRAQLSSASRQRHLRSRRRAREAPAPPLHAHADGDHPRLLRRAGQAGGGQPAGPGDAALARQSQGRRGRRQHRGQPARSGGHPHPLRRDDADGRSRPERAAPAGRSHGELPDHAGRGAAQGAGGAAADGRLATSKSPRIRSSASPRRCRPFGRIS